MYVVPRSSDRLVFPFHRCGLSIQVPDATPVLKAGTLRLGPLSTPGVRGSSLTIEQTIAEAIVLGPGMMHASAYFSSRLYDTMVGADLTLHVTLAPVHTAEPIRLAVSLCQRRDGEWTLNAPAKERRTAGAEYLPPLVDDPQER